MVALTERSTWDKVREEYELGKYRTLIELSERHQVSYQVLRNKIFKQNWKEPLITARNERLQKMEEIKVDLGKEYLVSSFKRAKKYEKIIDESQKALSTTNDGTPLLDVDAIVAYSKAELNIHALAKSALRISDKVDLTTGGQSIGDSFVTAIAKLRESPDTPKLTSQDIDKVLEAEIID